MLRMRPEQTEPARMEIDCREMTCYGDFVGAFNERLTALYAVSWTGEIRSLTECLLCIEQERIELVIRGAARWKELLDRRQAECNADAGWMQLIDVFHQNRDWVSVKLE